MSNQPIIPLNDWVFCRKVGRESIIAIPDTAKDEFEQGDVVAAGPYMAGPDGRWMESPIKAGHRVVFRGLRTDELIDYDGEKLLLIKVKDIVGLVNPEA